LQQPRHKRSSVGWDFDLQLDIGHGDLTDAAE
jgi:hypothetical protein